MTTLSVNAVSSSCNLAILLDGFFLYNGDAVLYVLICRTLKANGHLYIIQLHYYHFRKRLLIFCSFFYRYFSDFC